jgi:hypothetical protein
MLSHLCRFVVGRREPLVKYAESVHDSDYLNLYLEIEDYRKIAGIPHFAGCTEQSKRS